MKRAVPNSLSGDLGTYGRYSTWQPLWSVDVPSVELVRIQSPEKGKAHWVFREGSGYGRVGVFVGSKSLGSRFSADLFGLDGKRVILVSKPNDVFYREATVEDGGWILV